MDGRAEGLGEDDRRLQRTQALAALKHTIQEQLAEEFPDNGKDVATVIEDIEYHTMREQVLSRGERVDESGQVIREMIRTLAPRTLDR